MAQGSEEDPHTISDSEDEGNMSDPTALVTSDISVPIPELDQDSAARLCTLFNKHAGSMEQWIRDEIRDRIIKGEFRPSKKPAQITPPTKNGHAPPPTKYTKQSGTEPSQHPIYILMETPFGGPNWLEVTYQNWFLLNGIYGQRVRSSPLSQAGKWFAHRYRREAADLKYRGEPQDKGELTGEVMSILAQDYCRFKRQMNEEMSQMRKRMKCLCGRKRKAARHRSQSLPPMGGRVTKAESISGDSEGPGDDEYDEQNEDGEDGGACVPRQNRLGSKDLELTFCNSLGCVTVTFWVMGH
ncbi:hypothetical protein NM208_g10179 [Fusarium decemcellulare]|uniref:Uncharacterized protein n=1 Tax=Fusarium decemcellulare TaxID=57161 RepID=A0ACC1RYU6_9HYPO|nr:hypothetical protein NM208_g10179 [Fusarium decemcellulare]